MSRKEHIKVDLVDEELMQFEKIKQYFGLRTNAETVRLCIREAYRSLQARLEIVGDN